MRPPLTHIVDPDLLSQAPEVHKIPREFTDKFDVIVVMHDPTFIYSNWDAFKGKRVVWRTIGQSTPEHEAHLKEYRDQGLKVVRYSPMEGRLPNFIGEDAMIRFYKDPEEFKDYTGENEELITFAQDMKHRGEFCHFEIFEMIANGYKAHVYGPNNENAGKLAGGLLSYEEMKKKYRESRVYFYTGTQPASYTLNFIEAWMTGIPIVAIGPNLGNSLRMAGNLYEVSEIIGNDSNPCAFWSDNLDQLKSYVHNLYNNLPLAKQIGERGRLKAVKIFGKENIKILWKDFLASL